MGCVYDLLTSKLRDVNKSRANHKEKRNTSVHFMNAIDSSQGFVLHNNLSFITGVFAEFQLDIFGIKHRVAGCPLHTSAFSLPAPFTLRFRSDRKPEV